MVGMFLLFCFGQDLAKCPANPQRMQSPISRRRLHSSRVSLPSGPKIVTERDGVRGGQGGEISGSEYLALSLAGRSTTLVLSGVRDLFGSVRGNLELWS